jgi:hypothetical protein
LTRQTGEVESNAFIWYGRSSDLQSMMSDEAASSRHAMMPCLGFGRTNGIWEAWLWRIIQALGSNATTAGFSADHGTEDRLLEALTNADRARGPPREAVALERARDGIPKRA